MGKITLKKNMDNGYGAVYCVQKQEFDIDKVHEYFKDSLYDDDDRFDNIAPFESVESIVEFLNNHRDALNDTLIMESLDNTEIFDNFLSTCNPNGSGNSVDCLVLEYKGEVLFE